MDKITTCYNDFETIIDNVINDTQSTTPISQFVDLRPSERLSHLLSSKYRGEILAIENKETIIRCCFAYIYPEVDSGAQFLANRLAYFVNTFIISEKRILMEMIKMKYIRFQ
jgi:hypothetical protein